VQASLKSRKGTAASFAIGTAEKKLLAVFVYFEFLVGFSLVTFSLNVRFNEEVRQGILEYFLCEQNGHDPRNPCSRSEIDRYGVPGVSAMSYIIFASYPIVNLIYAVNIKKVRELCSRKKGKKGRHDSKYKRPSVLSSRQRKESVLSKESNF